MTPRRVRPKRYITFLTIRADVEPRISITVLQIMIIDNNSIGVLFIFLGYPTMLYPQRPNEIGERIVPVRRAAYNILITYETIRLVPVIKY